MATREELEARLAAATSPGQHASIRTKLAALGDSEVEVDEAPMEVTAEDLPEGVFDPDSPLEPIEQLADHEAAESRPEE